MVAEGFLVSLANLIGLPLGTKRRTNQTSPVNADFPDIVRSVLDMTRDDVCIGETPLYYSSKKPLNSVTKKKIDDLLAELNSVISWVTYDVLSTGISIYTTIIKDGRVVFVPFIEPVEVYLSKDKEIYIFNNGQLMTEDLFVVLFYEKINLQPMQGSSKQAPYLKYKIIPVGLSLKNVGNSITDLQMTEKAINQARALKKIVRWFEVEVGQAKADRVTEIVSDVSEGLNANSGDLVQAVDFDDQIQVFPVNKGIGSITPHDSVPNYDMKEIADLDYNLSKVFLAMRFPKSYADFSTHLTPTATSMIRGDIRYYKLITKARSIIETAIKAWIDSIPALKELELTFRLITLPSPESEDISNTLSAYTDFSTNIVSYLLDSTNTIEEANARLEAIIALLGDQTSIKGIDMWKKAAQKIIAAKYAGEAAPPDDGGEPTGGSGDSPIVAPPEGGTEKSTEETPIEQPAAGKLNTGNSEVPPVQ